MRHDLEQALSLLTLSFDLTDEESSELLTELETADLDPRLSRVLFPESGSHYFDVSIESGGRLLFVYKRIYDHTFMFWVRVTPNGNRRILEWRPVRNPSSTPQ